MASMNICTGDQAKLTLQVAEWCDYLEDYPMYAIRPGRSAAFLADVKLAVGVGVWNVVGYSEKPQPNCALHQVFKTLYPARWVSKTHRTPTMRSTPPMLGARVTATGWLGVAAAFVLGCGLILAFRF
jgi:hypothetical protein